MMGDPNTRLIEAARAALLDDGGICYQGDHDDCGDHACCGVVSCEPHADDCWVPRLRAALAAFSEAA